VLRLVFLSMRIEKFCSAGGKLFAQKKQERMDVQGPAEKKKLRVGNKRKKTLEMQRASADKMREYTHRS
jgi:hypothetical protein